MELASGPYLEPDDSVNLIKPYLFKIHSNIIFPPTSRSSKWSFSFRFPNQIIACVSHLSRGFCMSRLISSLS